jgi:hypothetical protein
MKIIKIISALIILVLLLVSTLSFALALTVTSVTTTSFQPGKDSVFTLELENDLKDDVKNVLVTINLANLPFNPIGSSEKSVEDIENNDEERFSFRVKSANDISPGDYKIPYVITYSLDNQVFTKQGTIGVTVNADPELSFSISTQTPIINQKDKLTLKIVNTGFANAKFLSLKLVPSGFTLLSESDIYIGSVDSDDFETATFDVIYSSAKPTFSAIINYKNFENTPLTKTINLPIKVYSKQEAINLGISQKNNTPIIIAIIITLIFTYILYRTIRKAIRKSRRNNKGS